MRVLLAGADGFIGGHLARGLAEAGHDTVSAVYGRAPGPGEVRVDLTKPGSLVDLPAGCEVVINASGIVDPAQGRERMFQVNLGGTRNLLAWSRQNRIRHFIQLSSVAVYGPLLLGEQRTEHTARLGLLVGLPYMRSKAMAERAVERAGVPYTLVRPPAVVGAGDIVVSAGFMKALCGTGIPLLPGAHSSRRVSLCLIDGLVETIQRLVAREALGDAIHAVDVDLSLAELSEVYAAALGRPCNFARCSWREALRHQNDAGFAWLAASARFGQHYARERAVRVLGEAARFPLAPAIQAGLSGLQGIKDSLS